MAMKWIGLVWMCLLAGMGVTAGEKGPSSLGVLAFGPDGVLFVGDPIGAAVYALSLGEGETQGEENPVGIDDLEGKIGQRLGIPAGDVLIHDMAVRPDTRELYLSVSSGRGVWTNAWATPNDVADASILLRIDAKGEIHAVDHQKLKSTRYAITNPVDKDKQHRWKKTRLRAETITDMVYHEGKLYIAGLSNEEFSSALRVVDYPFNEKATVTTVEIFHGAHGKWETAAPIRALLPIELNGKPHLLASYLCTPLVVFPLDQVQDGKHIRGRTIAELGSGSYPVDMIRVNNTAGDRILLANSNRSAVILERSEIEAFEGSITEKIDHKSGVIGQDVSMTGMLQLDLFGARYLVMARRLPSGLLSLQYLPLRT